MKQNVVVVHGGDSLDGGARDSLDGDSDVGGDGGGGGNLTC